MSRSVRACSQLLGAMTLFDLIPNGLRETLVKASLH
jgi:hypothetical protein